MMLKMGHKIHAEYQVCLAHGMHLAVIKVLYKKKANIEAFGPHETGLEEVTYVDDLITAEEENLAIQENEL